MFCNWLNSCQSKFLMRIKGRMEKTSDKNFLGRVIERRTRGYSVEANTKYIRNVINVLGLEESKPVMTPDVEEDANDRIAR